LKECVYFEASVKASPEAFPTLNTFILIHLRPRSMQKVEAYALERTMERQDTGKTFPFRRE
jgi:hypothetical protein